MAKLHTLSSRAFVQHNALELLSPAKNADIGIEAVNHGADAVYIGGPAFGARHNAGNSVQDIERLCTHAHRFGARIFITLNTILRDDELDDAQRMVQQIYEAGADALIVQDMGLLELDLPPIQLHASTQTDIRTPEKARFLQDVGFSQMVLARELNLQQIRSITDVVKESVVEHFIHGALCVAYSGQCFISHAHTGRSANRGDCSQACRLHYEVLDSQGRIVAHEKHVLSMKDNNQSENLRTLIDAGVRSFKIEGRYKDMAYVKNITGHYRKLLDAILEERSDLHASSSGSTTLYFTPDPDKNFQRGSTDYFTHGRNDDVGDDGIAALDSPKNAGQPIGHVVKVHADFFDIDTTTQLTPVQLHNGDGICYFTLHKELMGTRVNRAEPLAKPGHWRIYPQAEIATLKDLRAGTTVNRNGDHAWDTLMAGKTAERRIPVWMHWRDTAHGFELEVTDADGHRALASVAHPHEKARDVDKMQAIIRDNLGKLGATIFIADYTHISSASSHFAPASLINSLRREALEKLESVRIAQLPKLQRDTPVQPPVSYPEDTLTYLANVFNHKARDFYAKHGVKVIASAYEAQEENGEVSLMITKHCVRWTMSLCPKQAKGITGVQGTVRAEPMQLVNGKEKLTLRFDCKPCEMHVVGKIKKSVLHTAPEQPMTFYKTRPVPQMA